MQDLTTEERMAGVGKTPDTREQICRAVENARPDNVRTDCRGGKGKIGQRENKSIHK